MKLFKYVQNEIGFSNLISIVISSIAIVFASLGIITMMIKGDAINESRKSISEIRQTIQQPFYTWSSQSNEQLTDRIVNRPWELK